MGTWSSVDGSLIPQVELPPVRPVRFRFCLGPDRVFAPVYLRVCHWFVVVVHGSRVTRVVSVPGHVSYVGPRLDTRPSSEVKAVYLPPHWGPPPRVLGTPLSPRPSLSDPPGPGRVETPLVARLKSFVVYRPLPFLLLQRFPPLGVVGELQSV